MHVLNAGCAILAHMQGPRDAPTRGMPFVLAPETDAWDAAFRANEVSTQLDRVPRSACEHISRGRGCPDAR